MTSIWEQVGLDIDGEAAGDKSGHSVSMSSDGLTVAIGANHNDDNGNDSGHVRVYEYVNSTWEQKGSDINGEAINDQSGQSISMSSDGSIVAIGARWNDGNGSNSGHVRVYEFDSTDWVQKGSDIEGEAAGDHSGTSVSISSDGLTVAISAGWNDGNGSNSGHVRVYEFVNSTWTQKGFDIDGEAAGDLSGYSVSISSDGLTVAIGAVLNDGNGTTAGHVRVYKIGGVTFEYIAEDSMVRSSIHYIANTIECFTTDYRDVTSVEQAHALKVNHVIDLLLNLHDLQSGLITTNNTVPNTDGSVDAEGGTINDNGFTSGNVFNFQVSDVNNWKTDKYGENFLNATSKTLADQVSLGFEKLFQKEEVSANNTLTDGILVSGSPSVKFITSKVATLLNDITKEAHLKIASTTQIRDVLNYVLIAGARSVVDGKLQFQSNDVLTMYVDVKDFDNDTNTDRWEINLIHNL